MDWQSVINTIAIPINIILICVNVYLTYKARTLPYRQMIYSKQLEGFSEVIDTLSDFYVTAAIFIEAHDNKLNDETRVELINKTKKEATAFTKSCQKWMVYIPIKLEESLCDYLELFIGISAPSNIASKCLKDHVYAEDPKGLLYEEYLKIINTARTFLGTELLSRETLDLIAKIHGG